MRPIDFENVTAFEPMSEPVVWRQDAASHRSGTFNAVVLHGAVDSSSAGHALSPVVADVWTVNAPIDCAIAAGVAIGDTLERLESGDLLTVQSVSRNSGGWWLGCTAAERSPR